MFQRYKRNTGETKNPKKIRETRKEKRKNHSVHKRFNEKSISFKVNILVESS